MKLRPNRRITAVAVAMGCVIPAVLVTHRAAAALRPRTPEAPVEVTIPGTFSALAWAVEPATETAVEDAWNTPLPTWQPADLAATDATEQGIRRPVLTDRDPSQPLD